MQCRPLERFLSFEGSRFGSQTCEQGSLGSMNRRLPLFVAMGLTVLGLLGAAGCGMRGPLETPPRQVGDAPPSKPGEPPPHKPSILDPLIR